MKLTSPYQYTTIERVTLPSGARYYLCPQTGNKLASVTTILSATANKKELMEWRQRVGEKEAERVKKEAVGLGTLMHTHLENYILGQPRPGGNNHVRIMAEKMADQIIAKGLCHVEEVWGSEITLHCPELYAGATDLCGVYKGKPAIMDFKTAKKMRRREMIEDYFHQLAAYGLAHDETFGTQIRTGVIFMVSREYDFQEFVIEGDEFEHYKSRFLERFETYITQ